MDRLARSVPHWLASPMSVLSFGAAITGSVFFFLTAALAEWSRALWGGIAFAAAAVAWYLADMAAANRPPD